MKKQIIDFVITWVDGSDPLWFRQKQNAKKKQGVSVDIDDRIERYRDWEILKYLFRSIENFAPWVNNVYFVTCGHLPAWLNTECPKLQIVSHKDFIPEKYLPTFNSHSIEWNFHRIKNLSEHFVYFNDDMFLLHPIKPTDFFENGKPVDMLALQPDVANVEDTIMPYIYLNNTMLLAKYFDKRENMKKQPGAYFHIGMDHLWFDADPWQTENANKLQQFYCEEQAEHWDGVFLTDGTRLEEKALHPTAIIAVNAQASLAADGPYAEKCVRRFWNTPLRTGERRYYDNFLYLFAMLALSGNYRIYR